MVRCSPAIGVNEVDEVLLTRSWSRTLDSFKYNSIGIYLVSIRYPALKLAWLVFNILFKKVVEEKESRCVTLTLRGGAWI